MLSLSTSLKWKIFIQIFTFILSQWGFAASISEQQLKVLCAGSLNAKTTLDPTNLKYLTNPSRPYQYKLNVAYGNLDNNADGKEDINTDPFYAKNRRVYDVFYEGSIYQNRPVVMYFHPGGFNTGDKCYAYIFRVIPLKEILEAGFAFVAVNYRLGSYTKQGKRIAYEDHPGIKIPLNDGKRAIQHLRANASKYKIDPNKIILMGESAGAGIALWNATRDDGKNPNANGLVGQQSTRVTAALIAGGQATYDYDKWETIVFGQHSNYMYRRWRYSYYGQNQNGYETNYDFPDCYYKNFKNLKFDCDDPAYSLAEAPIGFKEFTHHGIKGSYAYKGKGNPAAEPNTQAYQLYLNETAAYRKDVDMLAQISKDDPPLYLESTGTADYVSRPVTNDIYHSKWHALTIDAYTKAMGGPVNTVWVGYQRGAGFEVEDLRKKRINFILKFE